MLARRVRLAGVDYLLCDARTTPPEDARRLSPRELDRLLATWGSKPALRTILAEFEQRKPERSRWLADRRLRFDEQPDLIAYELPHEIPKITPIQLPFEPVLAVPQPLEPTPMFDEQTHWIEVQIVGEDDEALAGVVCEIKLPNGKVMRRSSDRFGLIRIEGITSAGACEVSLPELDTEAWNLA